MKAMPSVTTRLQCAASAIPAARNTRWYLFGSTLHNREQCRDVDLLIIYDHEDILQARLLLEALEDCSMPQPLDLVILSAKEEAEMKFIENERAILVWPLKTEVDLRES